MNLIRCLAIACGIATGALATPLYEVSVLPIGAYDMSEPPAPRHAVIDVTIDIPSACDSFLFRIKSARQDPRSGAVGKRGIQRAIRSFQVAG